MKRFDTSVQYLNYMAIKEVAKLAWDDNLTPTNILNLEKEIIPGKKPTMRCCVYKERAIIGERIKLAMGGNKENPNVVEVLDIACDECPTSGYIVTDLCRGCIAHKCSFACMKGAITFDYKTRVAKIDKSKCVECGQCSKACPFEAIIKRERPCQTACKLGAISIDVEDNTAVIDNDKCISCGACASKCPFGAISNKSFILEIIDMLKNKEKNNEKIYAIIAPSIASQFIDYTFGQLITGIKKLGFDDVYEASLGADMVTINESKELYEKGFLTSSCCPAFVNMVDKYFSELKPYVSSNLSPMATIAKYIKEHSSKCKIIFIGPCIAKKMEIQKEEVKPYVDSVLTFVELAALFDSKNISLDKLEETHLNASSYFGRIFAKSGGLSEAVLQGLIENGYSDFNLKAIKCSGMNECKQALFKKTKNVLDANFIEGMACEGGCVSGPCILKESPKGKIQIEKYYNSGKDKDIHKAIAVMKEEN